MKKKWTQMKIPLKLMWTECESSTKDGDKRSKREKTVNKQRSKSISCWNVGYKRAKPTVWNNTGEKK